MFKLARYLKYFKKEVIVGPVFKLLEAVFELIVPLVMASIIDVGVKNHDMNYVLQRGGIMIGLGFAGLIFALICQYSASKASQGVGTILRKDLFSHINTLSHAEIDKIGANSLITRITNDVNQLQLAVAMLIRLMIRAPFLVIGSTVMAMILDMRIAVIFWVVAPIVAIVLYVVMHASVPYYKKRQAKVDEISLITSENLSGARVIRAFEKQEKEKKRFAIANDEITDLAVSVGKISAVLNPATFAILNTAMIAILWFGGKRVDLGLLKQGEVIALVNYMTQISLALVVVAQLVVIFTKASASAARVNEVFALESTLKEGNVRRSSKDIAPMGATPRTSKSHTGRTQEQRSSHGSFVPSVGNMSEKCEQSTQETKTCGQTEQIFKDAVDNLPKISFEDVCFAYPDSDEYSLEHLTVDIMPGETIGVIGGTGSGKSTLVQLLPRFYDVTKGEIKIDGKNVKEYTFKTLRKKFGIVPQKAVLFHGTILENMRWANENASLEQIEKAIEIAQAKEFVEAMPNQYETKIAQGGKNLSGGQKQRLTIARALVSEPEILILDDSSSALDYATDRKLRDAIKEQSKEMTVFIVSQRANSIGHADKIIVLDDGKVMGIGTHKQLLKECEVYREICLSQFSKEELEEQMEA